MKMTIRTQLKLPVFLVGFMAMTGSLAPPCLAIPTDIILFQDTTDTISVFVNGSPFGTCSESGGCTVTTEDNGGASIPTFGGLAFPINFNIYEDPSLAVLSDTFSLSVQDFSDSGGTPNTVVATFTSDVDGTPLTALTGGALFNLVETGAIQDLGTVTFTNAIAIPLTALDFQFVSDVPEPSSLVLLGVGLLGLMGLRRRSGGQQLRRSV